MEFKQNLLKLKKARQNKERKEKGYKRIKIRGRKRWVNPKKAAQSASAE